MHALQSSVLCCGASLDAMAPPALVTLLSVSLLFSFAGVLMPTSFVSGILVLSTTSSPLHGPPGGEGNFSTTPLQTDELQANLAVNQLAILHLLRKMAPGKYILLHYIFLIFFIKKYRPMLNRLA